MLPLYNLIEKYELEFSAPYLHHRKPEFIYIYTMSFRQLSSHVSIKLSNSMTSDESVSQTRKFNN